MPLNGYREFPVTGEHGVDVENLPWQHKDPFDHLLLAQARTEAMILLSKDGWLAEYGEPVRLV